LLHHICDAGECNVRMEIIALPRERFQKVAVADLIIDIGG
jgi:hypothetical protein